jgi:signal transduction histidine kinase
VRRAAVRSSRRRAPLVVLATPLPTTVSGVDVGRYRPDVERTIYLCCLEALQNTYKHAETATAAHVRVAARGRELTLEVTDNGVGFEVGTIARGAGLRNMRDRVASLGGSLMIDAARGRGKCITGAIPLTAASRPLPGALTPSAGQAFRTPATSHSLPRDA